MPQPTGPTTYGDINQRTAAWAATEMLDHAEPILVLSRYGVNKPLPKNRADNVKFRRPVPFEVSTTQVTEGVTPTPKRMRYEDVPATMGQYVDVIEITDRVHNMSEDPVLMDASVLAGEQAAETIEMVTYGVLKAGTTVFYGAIADAARTDVNDKITTARQRAVTRSLEAQRAKKITSMLGASPKIATEAVEAGYIAFGHTDLGNDIRDMAGFEPVSNYGSSAGGLPQEKGKVEDCRYILSPLLVPFVGGGSATANGMITDGSNVDVYPVIYVTKNSYGLVPLKGAGAIVPAVLNPDKPSKSDPAGQRGYVSWKAWYTCVILNDAWLARLEVGATDLG